MTITGGRGDKLTNFITRCFPPNITDTVFDFPHNYDVIPPMMFEGCVPSQGPKEIFYVNAVTNT